MKTVSEIMDAIGRDRVRKSLFGLSGGEKSISQAVWAGKMPASWFAEIDHLCQEVGVDCPRRLFNFKAANEEVVKIPSTKIKEAS